MKNLSLLCLILTCIGFGSCKKEETKLANEAKKIAAEKPISTECYKALYEKDTINLKINNFKNGEVTGDLEMKIENMPTKLGQIVGEFRGDTLFASYTFIQGANEKKTFKNPMAFLKNGNELILGNGKIEFSLGASYFAKDEPIDFERVKYKFTTVECSEK
jgi:hypothetical protein